MHVKRCFGDLRAGLVMTLMDVWVLDARMCAQFEMACWCPVDHDPAPPNVLKFFRESGAIPIAMSRFGQKQLAEFDSLYVPHGCDTKVFRPIDKAEAREKVGVPADEFAVGMVAANKGNPSRKSFVAALEAFAEFRRGHENAKLYLQTDLAGAWSTGIPLGPVITALGIPEEAIGMADPYAVYFHPLAPEVMALFYSSMDVLLSPSTGEGFGIPVLEAQACGTPAVVTDFSAMREVCAAGWHVKGHRWWTPQESWQCQPEVAGIVDALEKCYAMPKDARQKLSHAARSHALKYDVDLVMDTYMLPALEAVRERLDARMAPVELKLRDAA
jgi:glycosyltransferase involved in cell wall biosynthesis